MSRFVEMLSEQAGGVSLIRVQSFLTLVYVLGFYVTYCTIRERELNFELVVALLVAAFAPKVVQKFAEAKPGQDDSAGER